MPDSPSRSAATSDESRRFLIHIGYPKTATTFLQQQVFAQSPDLVNVGRPTPWYEADEAGVRRALLCDAAPDLAGVRQTLTAFGRDESNRENTKPAILSDEHYATGALTSPIASLSAAAVLERLHKVLPAARVLIVIRHQADILLAEYQNDLKMRRTTQSPDAWLAAQKARADGGALQAFDFTPIVGRARDLFGASQVTVLLYEDLKQAPSRFEAGLAEALEIPCETIRPYLGRMPENTTPALEHAYLRLRRHIPDHILRHPLIKRLKPLAGLSRIRRIGRRLPLGKPKPLRFSEASQAFIRERYAASNAELAAMCDVPLAAYGYPYAVSD